MIKKPPKEPTLKEYYIEKYPELPLLVLPDIPNSVAYKVKIIEELLASRSWIFAGLHHARPYLTLDKNEYLTIWLHEAYEAFMNPEMRIAEPADCFKLRFLEYEDLKIVTIRRKWPQRDFVITPWDEISYTLNYIG